MLISKDEASIEFNRRLRNFLSKAAIPATYAIVLNRVEIVMFCPANNDTGDVEVKTITHYYDYSKPPTYNVFQIREKLLPYYPTVPVIKQYRQRKLSPEEFRSLISRGLSVMEATLTEDFDIDVNVLRLEKLIHEANNMFFRNLTDGDIEIYHFTDYPVMSWYWLLFNDKISAMEIFMKSAILVKKEKDKYARIT